MAKMTFVPLPSSHKPPRESKETTKHLDRIALALAKSKRAIILVGAGISTSAGIPDFRSKEGLYALAAAASPSSSSPSPTPSTAVLSGQALFSSAVYSSTATRAAHFKFIGALKHSIDASVEKARIEGRDVTPTHGFFRLLKKRGVLRRVYSQNIDGMEGSSSGLGRVALEGVAICGMGRGDKGGKGKGKQIEGEYVMLHGSVHAVRCTVCEWVGEWSREHGDAFGTGDTPSCPDCEERADERRRLGKRFIPSRAYLRPSIVLYNETSPAASTIGSVSINDLSSSPDLIIVMGTSLKIPGFKKLVKEFSKAAKARGGICVFVNGDEIRTKEWDDVFDYQVTGKCDDFVHRVMGDWKRTRPQDWTTQKTLEQSLGFKIQKTVTAGQEKSKPPPTARNPLFPVPTNIPVAPTTPKKRPCTPDNSSPPPKRGPLLSTRPRPPPSPNFALLSKPFDLTSPSSSSLFAFIASSPLTSIVSTPRSTPPSSPAKGRRESPRRVPYVLIESPRKSGGGGSTRKGRTAGESPSKRW